MLVFKKKNNWSIQSELIVCLPFCFPPCFSGALKSCLKDLSPCEALLERPLSRRSSAWTVILFSKWKSCLKDLSPCEAVLERSLSRRSSAWTVSLQVEVLFERSVTMWSCVWKICLYIILVHSVYGVQATACINHLPIHVQYMSSLLYLKICVIYSSSVLFFSVPLSSQAISNILLSVLLSVPLYMLPVITLCKHTNVTSFFYIKRFCIHLTHLLFANI